MQAPLSNTASGKLFRNRSLTASPTHLSHRRTNTQEALFASGYPSDFSAALVAEGPGLAHDAGNLLGALGLYCELLALPGVLRAEHRHYAEELQFLSGRSRDLIDRLLNPRTTGGKSGDSGAEQVVVPDVIEGCRGLLNAVALRAVAVAYGAGAAFPVAVSREALERILVNLTKNAAESMDPDRQGAITLRVTCEPGICESGEVELRRIVLTVEDKGRGMNSAAVKVLMAHVSAGKVRSDRRGLGFQVVRELVGASGGQLRLMSESEGNQRGTTVEVTWVVAPGGSIVPAPRRDRPMILVAAKQSQAQVLAGSASC